MTTLPTMDPSKDTAEACPLGKTNFDIWGIRDDFPILTQTVYAKPLVYLDNAATAQKPRAVLQALENLYSRSYGNVNRGLHFLSMRSTKLYDNARQTARSFLNANDASEIVFTRGTTESINLVAQSFVRPRLNAGDEILITGMEHHSNIVPWQMLVDATGARLRFVPVLDNGEIDPGEFGSMLTSRTKFASVIHVSNSLGTVNPVKSLVTMAHGKGIPIMIDAAQSASQIPLDVADMGCDFLAFSGHKVYGPTGIGVLYGKREHLASMPPWQGGGDMIRSVTMEKTLFADPPQRFEAGTPNIGGAVGMAAALDYVMKIGMSEIGEHNRCLLTYTTERLISLPKLRLIGTAREKTGLVSFVLEGIHPHDVGTILDREGIAVRAGHHCAQPVMHRFGVPATVRVSFAVYNTQAEIDRFIEALQGVRRFLG